MRTTTGTDFLVLFQADLALGAEAITARGTGTISKMQLLATSWTSGDLDYLISQLQGVNNACALALGYVNEGSALGTGLCPSL